LCVTGTYVRGKDDLLVKVKPMLGRVEDGREYLGTEQDGPDSELIRRHTRSGRPLGGPDFVESLEAQTGRPLAPLKRSPKPHKRCAGNHKLFALSASYQFPGMRDPSICVRATRRRFAVGSSRQLRTDR